MGAGAVDGEGQTADTETVADGGMGAGWQPGRAMTRRAAGG